jgi:hypothetical protein
VRSRTRTILTRGRCVLAGVALLSVLCGCSDAPQRSPDLTGTWVDDDRSPAVTLTVDPEGTLEFDAVPENVIAPPIGTDPITWSRRIQASGDWRRTDDPQVRGGTAVDVWVTNRTSGRSSGFQLTLDDTGSDPRLYIVLDGVADRYFWFHRPSRG